MLQTISNQDFNVNYDATRDSTVFVSPGTAVLGSGLYVIPFRGDSMTFRKMTSFGSGSSVYQYSAMTLQYSGTDTIVSGPDLTCTTATAFSSLSAPIYPKLDSTSLYPIGLFMFYTDGTYIDLISNSRIF